MIHLQRAQIRMRISLYIAHAQKKRLCTRSSSSGSSCFSKMKFAYLVFLVCSLVEVHSQTFPYVSFMGQTLANNSYVDLSLVGTSGSDSVQCHTDLSTCCTGPQGPHRGDWYFPNGNRLQFSGDIFERRDDRIVELRRSNSATLSPVGIYRCDIATNDVFDDTDTSVRATVYVGLYTASEGKLKFCSPLGHSCYGNKTGYKTII